MKPVQELLLKMADDALIMGHRDSEWTGLGPTLEEDIAFSSMSQDKIGHAWNMYRMLHEQFDMPDADALGFRRSETEYKCSHLTEVPTQDYAFALMRQFCFDHAAQLRYKALHQSSFEPLADFARKVTGEVKYHILHADSWTKRLGIRGSEESRARMQSALNEVFPLALGLFEPSPLEDELVASEAFIGEVALQQQWIQTITPILEAGGYVVPEVSGSEPAYGGRHGYHTDFLQPLLTEMTEVSAADPEATW